MEIHPFEKAWLGVSLVLIVAWIATVTYGAVGAGVQMVDDSGGTVDPQLVAEGSYEQLQNFEEPGVRRTDDGVAVYMVAYRFAFNPGSSQPVEVPANTPVTLYVTSSDVTHGFQIVGTNVNTMVIPGQVAEITVVFDETGTHGVVCNEYCGAFHHTMQGQVRVVPEEQFQEGNQ
jgi:cytochrome c oxidase subunit 2